MSDIGSGPDNIPIAGQRSRGDVRDAFRLHFRTPWYTRVSRILLALLLVAGFALLIALDIRLNPGQTVPWTQFVLPLLVPLALLVSEWWLPYLFAWQMIRRTPKLLEPLSGHVNRQEIHLQEAQGSATLAWTELERYKASAQAVVVYLSNNVILFFQPTLFRSQDDWDRFRALLEEKLSPAKPSLLSYATPVLLVAVFIGLIATLFRL